MKYISSLGTPVLRKCWIHLYKRYIVIHLNRLELQTKAYTRSLIQHFWVLVKLNVWECVDAFALKIWLNGWCCFVSVTTGCPNRYNGIWKPLDTPLGYRHKRVIIWHLHLICLTQLKYIYICSWVKLLELGFIWIFLFFYSDKLNRRVKI